MKGRKMEDRYDELIGLVLESMSNADVNSVQECKEYINDRTYDGLNSYDEETIEGLWSEYWVDFSEI